MRTPGSLLVVVTHACALLCAAVLACALRMPATGVSVAAAGTGLTVVTADGTAIPLAHDAAIELRGAHGAMRQAARELVNDFSPSGSPGGIAAWFAARDRLAAVIAGPGAAMVLPGGRALPLQPRPRQVRDVPADTWLLLLQGCLFALLGTWLIALRPRAWGARMFALSCAGLVAASFSGALYDARELSADGTLLRVAQAVNFTGSLLSSSALLALFLCEPQALVRPAAALALVGAATLWGLGTGLGWLPLQAFYAGLLVLSAAFVIVLLAQWHRCRRDPAARATVRWVGLTTLVGSGQLALAMAAPQVLDLPSLGGDGMTIVPLSIVYGSIAFGIGRNRLFDLDRWTYRVILGAAAALGFLAIDAALVGVVRVDGPVALGVTLLVVGYLYLPLRGFFWRRIVGRELLSDSEKFQIATEVAFAPSPAARRDGWRALLRRLFDPLDIQPATGAVPDVVVRRDGAALCTPATGDDVALCLSFRAGGSRLFGTDQVRLAREMVALMRRAETARAEYGRGVGEERQRIARDLHDDVCATLLTGLQRQDVAKLRTDVRDAMSDIRTIISGLTGERIELEQALADLRFETAERLGAAGIELAWPLPDRPHAPRLLDYPVYRNLIASHREAISNILKHAHASRVAVDVRETADLLSIVVADNGRGRCASEGGEKGHGIANMRHRLVEMGGRFGLASDAAGTRVDIAIPLG